MADSRAARAAWLTAALTTALVRVASAGCTKDTDCKGDRICEGEVCVSPLRLLLAPIFGANYPEYQVITYRPGYPQLLDCNSGRGWVKSMVVIDEILQTGGAVAVAGGLVLGSGSDEGAHARAGAIRLVAGTAVTPLGVSLRLDTY